MNKQNYLQALSIRGLNFIILIILGISVLSAQNWDEKNKLLASDGFDNDKFGNSVSISGDYAIIGAPFDNNYNGSAYIFEYTSNPQTIFLDLKVYLEGPFNGTDMNTGLNSWGYLPLSQPYDTDTLFPYQAAWHYTGPESVASIPNENVVDWILIELRDATDADSAYYSLARQAAFLLNDGSVVGLDGYSLVQFDVEIQYNLYVVIWHRNHLAIMSANPLTETGGVFSYDFRYDQYQTYKLPGYSNPINHLIPGVWGMIAGDGHPIGDLGFSSVINTGDNPHDFGFGPFGYSGYSQWDYDLDGNCLNQEYKIWYDNFHHASLIP